METAGCQIERAQAADIDAMLNLWRCIPGIGISKGDTVQSLRGFMDKNPSACLILRIDGRLIGTVLGGFDGRRGYIYHLAVHPDYRGRGYGKALLDRVCRELNALGAPKIHLFAFNDNQAAATFYPSQGWEERRDIRVYSWDANRSRG
ncbi:MAG TPA: GNAT family N-acetyltransferase [Syntrophomonadaceae bacterium]|nr:GNAT family N-acetyltransferase [Syntrophomonadaceae bacterium]